MQPSYIQLDVVYTVVSNDSTLTANHITHPTDNHISSHGAPKKSTIPSSAGWLYSLITHHQWFQPAGCCRANRDQ